MNKLAVFDIDGTLRKERSCWRFMHSVFGFSKVASRYYLQYQKREISYKQLVDLDAALWRGISRHDIIATLTDNPLRDGAEDLVQSFRQNGYDLLAISTGLDVLNHLTCSVLGITNHISNHLNFDENNRCTGEVDIIVTDDSKDAALYAYVQNSSKHYDYVFAVGDSDADKSLFAASNKSLAIMPMNEEVEKAATYVIKNEPINVFDFMLE